MNSTTVRLPDEMRERLEVVAARNGMKPTAFIRFAVATALNSAGSPPEPIKPKPAERPAITGADVVGLPSQHVPAGAPERAVA